MPESNPVLPADTEACALARDLIRRARHAALAVLQPVTALPSVSRIALATDEEGRPLSLISGLSTHTQALVENSTCALLIGEPGGKGDPLTHPRLTLHCAAQLIARGTPEHETLRTRYLEQRPKAGLYVDFADFRFVRFGVNDGFLNGGFGRAYRLGPDDL